MISDIKFWVRKHPTTDTLCTALANIPAGEDVANWEHMTEADLETWKAAELAAGWVPAIAQEIDTAPEYVRSAQLRQWLIDQEKLSAIEAAFDNPAYWPDEKSRLKAKARWEYEVNVVRADPMVVAMGQILGMTPDAIAQAFREADQIP